ncbi:pyridoxine/pyridoxamine 5'-phosphate oxidase-like [Leptopilina heterotoma]|uniref:pyridoxine/pyridoxamine 5'-phosphate oxidase-like n=1 Tax=Leptopilina heterotoma TaxID=63436 RepID=UPI001CA84B3F|nr:pyridoxine/pyridoxamine 5'-phosphate oxidase-like [Leptopilina heterotoma]
MANTSGQNENYSVNLADMRIKYKDKNETFTEDQLSTKEPFGQFKVWFELACNTPTILEPNAMLLGTASKDGIPSVRPVLLKGYGPDSFKFYTNYESRKGKDLDENPNAALTFFWESLRRTIRIEGTVEKTSSEDSDEYFKGRPFPSQIGAWASKQSKIISGRDVLMIREREYLSQFSDKNVPRPNYWGGYHLKPKSVEFWQGQSDRLHDRIRFRRPVPGEKVDNILLHQGENGWVYERLSP